MRAPVAWTIRRISASAISGVNTTAIVPEGDVRESVPSVRYGADDSPSCAADECRQRNHARELRSDDPARPVRRTPPVLE